MELYGLPSGTSAPGSHIQAYDRTGKAWRNLYLDGQNLYLNSNSGGNVGIGTMTPSASLEVNGTAKFDGLVTFNSAQTFPGTGTITGITTASGSGLTGGATSGAPSLAVDSTVARTSAGNTFTGAQTITAVGTTLTVSGGTTGLNATGSTYGVYGGGSTGVYGVGSTGVLGTGNGSNSTGVYGNGEAGSTGVYGVGYMYGVYGVGGSWEGVGVYGTASFNNATAIAGVFNNTAGGKILSGQNNGTEMFSVDGLGNVTALGNVAPNSGLSSGGFGRYIEEASVTYPSGGAGMELYGLSAGATGSHIQAYDRTGSAWRNLYLDGEILYLNANTSGSVVIGGSGGTPCVKFGSGGTIAGSCSSDARLKAAIVPFAPVLSKVVQLQPVHYRWRSAEFPEYHFGEALNSGLIAQEVEKVFPEMVGVDAHGYRTVNYSELPYLLLAAIRELKAENDTLQTRLDKQSELLRALEARLARLEQSAADDGSPAMSFALHSQVHK